AVVMWRHKHLSQVFPATPGKPRFITGKIIRNLPYLRAIRLKPTAIVFRRYAAEEVAHGAKG
ncbi:MAG TPA: hypothetical protein VG796_14375, partial [Verrucomicrobiales bacterium]|nr:hypothetical protein [Verrucomicrobiales bacterium]